jgi:quercetin dioxygenase-like cupin family protein
MSFVSAEYGPERYFGRDGRIDFKFKPASDPPHSVNPQTALTHLVTGSETGGAYGLFRCDFGSGPGGTGNHFHRTFQEDILVLSGSMALYDGERWRDAGPGDFLHIPPGGLHAFKNQSGEPASMLMIFSPGGPRERYFAELGQIADLDDQQRREFLLSHDNWFVDEGPNM